jgi:hypothetical protein
MSRAEILDQMSAPATLPAVGLPVELIALAFVISRA